MATFFIERHAEGVTTIDFLSTARKQRVLTDLTEADAIGVADHINQLRQGNASCL
jgi:hypothetical protein